MKNSRKTFEYVFLMFCIVGGSGSIFMLAFAFNVVYDGSLLGRFATSLQRLGNGFGTDYLLLSTNGNLSIEAILADWRSELPQIESFGFNTVRLAFAFNNSGSTAHSILVYSELDQVLTLLDQNDLHVVLDLHNWNDMNGYFGSPSWVQSWSDLALNYKNDQRIVAYELFNEPYTSTWHSTVQTGGAGGQAGTGCLQALAKCVDAIRATGDFHAIVYPDPWFIIPYSQIMNPDYISTSLKRRNVIMTFHCWYGDNQTTNTMKADLTRKEEEVAAWQKYYPVWIGEYGWYTGRAYDQTIQQVWLVVLTQFAIRNGIKVSWWLHGYTDGRSQAYQLCETVMHDAAMPMPIQAKASD